MLSDTKASYNVYMKKAYTLRGNVWLWPGDAPWHFVSVDKKTSKEIRETYGNNARGFGSLPVIATIGKTTWTTSIFPERKTYMYMLPIKAAVRKKEDIYDGDTVTFTIKIK